MKTSEILQDAKKRLQKTDDEAYSRTTHIYVCLAVVKGRRASLEEREKRADLIRRLSNSLEGSAFVTSWLRKYHPAVLDHLRNTGQIQAYRHAWVDSLIAEYKANGD